MPFSRGMQSTIYVKTAPGVTASDLRKALDSRFQSETFVHVMPEGEIPHTRYAVPSLPPSLSPSLSLSCALERSLDRVGGLTGLSLAL